MQNYDQIVSAALNLAQKKCLDFKQGEISAYHILWGLIKNPNSFSHTKLQSLLPVLEKKIQSFPQLGKAPAPEQLRLSTDASTWFTYAQAQAIEKGKDTLEESDLLAFLPKIFSDLPINLEDLHDPSADQDTLTKELPFLLDLNDLASKGKLDPVIGRDSEISSVMEILERRGKNNPILVGPAGVGKTAIAEGLALKIFQGEVPDVLKGKKVYSLNLGALLGGTKYRGDFEERLQKLLKFIKEKQGESILFIDEIHQIVGAGKTDGAMDAANLLKPALARGELHCIGATTDDEYQKYILGDTALARRFRSVSVKEPSQEDAIEILIGLKEKYEIHHGIKISDKAITSAVKLSSQYITDRFLPDKAIDLIDEACAAMKLAAQAMPKKLVDLEAEIRSKQLLSQVEKNNKQNLDEISSLKKEFELGKKEWEKQVFSVKQVSELKNKLDRLRFDLEKFTREQNYEEASRIKYSLIPEIEKQLEQLAHYWILGEKEVAEVISTSTGIPLEKILLSKQQAVLELPSYLESRIFGQEQAVKEVSEILISSHAGLTDPNKPLGSFLLLGPSGVGKTETAKAVCQFLFHQEKNLIRLDLSEYSEKHSVSKLIGAPAGYIGHDEGGILTESIRRQPYSVILFDEVEKAHPDFSDILLQILDEGRLTDNKGRVINFRNTVIFLTSNTKDYKASFRPEVLGRFDAILTYNHLGDKTINLLINKQIKALNERLKSKNLEITLSEEVKNALITQGVSSEYGARPLQSAFNRLIIRPLSHKLLTQAEDFLHSEVEKKQQNEEKTIYWQAIFLDENKTAIGFSNM